MKQDRFQRAEHNNIISRSYYFYLLALRPWVRPQTWFPIPNWDWWSVNCYLLQGTVISCALSLASTHGSRHLTNVATSQEDLWVMFSFESPEGIRWFYVYLLTYLNIFFVHEHSAFWPYSPPLFSNFFCVPICFPLKFTSFSLLSPISVSHVHMSIGLCTATWANYQGPSP